MMRRRLAGPAREPPGRAERPVDRAPPASASRQGREAAADRAADAAVASGAPLDLALGIRDVRIEPASPLAGPLGARAFALGSTIGFAPGAYAPETPAGRRLLAHELAHVAQQRRDGRATIDRQPAGKPLRERVVALAQELEAAAAPMDKALVAKALALGKEAAAALTALKAARPKASKAALDEARYDVRLLARTLVEKGEVDAGLAVATGAGDTAVEAAVVETMSEGAKGVRGQQASLGRIGKLAGKPITGPTAGEGSREWLERSTEDIGQALRALETRWGSGTAAPVTLGLLEDLLKDYFAHTVRDDVKPHPKGSLAAATVVADEKIEADCDVFATYGARTLRAAGWTTVGYLVILPEGIAGHAVVLVKRKAGSKTQYAGVSSQQVAYFGTGTSDAGMVKDALLKLALAAYSAPKTWKAYYLAAGAGGAYDTRLLNPVASKLTPLAKQP